MPQLGSYKALGSALGKYKASQYETESKEYAKNFETFKGAQERSFYGAIGSTVANIIGISEELRLTKDLERFKDLATDLPGVESKTETYKPWGFLPERERTTYTSAFTGKPIDDSSLMAIGKEYELTGESIYSDIEAMEGPEGTAFSKGIVRRRAARALGIDPTDEAFDEAYWETSDNFEPEWASIPQLDKSYDDVDLPEMEDDIKLTEFDLIEYQEQEEFELPMSLRKPSDNTEYLRRLNELEQQKIRGEAQLDVEIGPIENIIDESPVEAFGASMVAKAEMVDYLEELEADKAYEQDNWFGHTIRDKYEDNEPEGYPSQTFAPGYEQNYSTAGGRAGSIAYRRMK